MDSPSIVRRSWVVKNEKQIHLKHSEIQRETPGITVMIKMTLRDRNGCNGVPDVSINQKEKKSVHTVYII